MVHIKDDVVPISWDKAMIILGDYSAAGPKAGPKREHIKEVEHLIRIARTALEPINHNLFLRIHRLYMYI